AASGHDGSQFPCRGQTCRQLTGDRGLRRPKADDQKRPVLFEVHRRHHAQGVADARGSGLCDVTTADDGRGDSNRRHIGGHGCLFRIEDDLSAEGGAPPLSPTALPTDEPLAEPAGAASVAPRRARATMRYLPGGRLPNLNSPLSFGGTLVMPPVLMLIRGPSITSASCALARFATSP